MASGNLGLEGYFQIDPESSIDCMIKEGVHRTFVSLIRQNPMYTDQLEVKDSTVNALRLLSKVNVPTKTTFNKEERKVFKSCFYSGRHGGMVKFVRSRITGKPIVKLIDTQAPEELLWNNVKKDEKGEAFKGEVVEFLQSHVTHDVEELIFKGVMTVLNAAEDFAGPTRKTFPRHKRLFNKLAQVYGREPTKSLIEARGCYSCWWAMDEITAAYDQEKEDEVMGMMG